MVMEIDSLFEKPVDGLLEAIYKFKELLVMMNIT